MNTLDYCTNAKPCKSCQLIFDACTCKTTFKNKDGDEQCAMCEKIKK